VTPFLRLTVALVCAGALALGGKTAWSRFLRWRRKDPVELEKLRRLDINRRGRIGAGRIVDLVEAQTAGANSALVSYSYEVAGVTYEAAQEVSALPEIAVRARFLSGQTVSVKYDPRRPANSIIACEEWNGLGTRGWGLGAGE
jgi:hypothetical protein